MTANEADSVETKDVGIVQGTETFVDTHHDKGITILDAYDGDREWTQEEENKLRRKIDYKLMPILCFTYGLQYYDKAMLGQAVSLKSIRGLVAGITARTMNMRMLT